MTNRSEVIIREYSPNDLTDMMEICNNVIVLSDKEDKQ